MSKKRSASALLDLRDSYKRSYTIRDKYDLNIFRDVDIVAMNKCLKDKRIPDFDGYLSLLDEAEKTLDKLPSKILLDKYRNTTIDKVLDLGMQALHKRDLMTLVFSDTSLEEIVFDKDLDEKEIVPALYIRFTRYLVANVLKDHMRSEKSLKSILGGKILTSVGTVKWVLPGSTVRVILTFLLKLQDEDNTNSPFWVYFKDTDIEKHKLEDGNLKDALNLLIIESNRLPDEVTQKELDRLEKKDSKSQEVITKLKDDLKSEKEAVRELKKKLRDYEKNNKKLNTSNIKLEKEYQTQKELIISKDSLIENLTNNNKELTNNIKKFEGCGKEVENLTNLLETVKDTIKEKDDKIRLQLIEIQELKTVLNSRPEAEEYKKEKESSFLNINGQKLSTLYAVARVKNNRLYAEVVGAGELKLIQKVNAFKPLPIKDGYIIEIRPDATEILSSSERCYDDFKFFGAKYIGKSLGKVKEDGKMQVRLGDNGVNGKMGVVVDAPMSHPVTKDDIVVLDKNLCIIGYIPPEKGDFLSLRYDRILDYISYVGNDIKPYLITGTILDILGEQQYVALEAGVHVDDAKEIIIPSKSLCSQTTEDISVGRVVFIENKTQVVWVYKKDVGYKMSSLYPYKASYYTDEIDTKELRDNLINKSTLLPVTNLETGEESFIEVSKFILEECKNLKDCILIVDEASDIAINYSKITNEDTEKITVTKTKKRNKAGIEKKDYPPVTERILVIGKDEKRDVYKEAFLMQGVDIEFITGNEGLNIVKNALKRYNKIIFNTTAVPHDYLRHLRIIERKKGKNKPMVAYPESGSVHDQISKYMELSNREFMQVN